MNKVILEQLQNQLDNIKMLIGHKALTLQFANDPLYLIFKQSQIHVQLKVETDLWWVNYYLNRETNFKKANEHYAQLMENFANLLVWLADLVFNIPQENTNISLQEFNQYFHIYSDLLMIYQIMEKKP